MIYLAIFLLLIILAVRYDIQGKTKYRDQWYIAMQVILILIAGLRFRLGEDTINYIYAFYFQTPYLGDLDIDTFLSSGQPPLWILLNSMVKSLGGRFFVVQLVQAAILNTLMLKYFKKHSPYPFACVAFFLIWRYQWFSMVVMKAAIALSIMLFANDFFLNKKYIKGIFLMLIAVGFHLSSLVLMIIPFMTFLRFNKLGVFLMGCAYIFGFYLQRQLGDVFELFEFSEGVSSKLNGYMDNGYMDQTHNFNYVIVQILPLILYPVLSIVYLKRNCKDSDVLKLEPILVLALLFQMMQFSINVMYRFIYALSPYYIIFIVHYFIEFSKKSISLKSTLSYFRTFLILLPLIASIAYLWKPFTHPGFNPYASVIERSFDEKREKYYSNKSYYGFRYQKSRNYY